jgi:dihydropteroate synthase
MGVPENMTNPMIERNPGSELVQGSPVWTAGPFQWKLEKEALVMAILNITPDSFSDGGLHFTPEDTFAAARIFVEEGADILDIGGESTRPGAAPVTLVDELARVIPIIKQLVTQEKVALSIDTCKPEVAKAALQAGAHIVNDISGFRDPAMIEVCANSDCGIVVMHMQGTPQTMQKAPDYLHVIEEVRDFFDERLETLTQEGIEASRIVFDPGIGFGKNLEHNLALLNGVGSYLVKQRPILMGLSRKSIIGSLLGDPTMCRREAPTQALTALTRANGAMIHRVHAVRENLQSLRMIEAIL